MFFHIGLIFGTNALDLFPHGNSLTMRVIKIHLSQLVLYWTVFATCLRVASQSEKEGTDAPTGSLRPLSHVRCSCRGTLRAAFRYAAHRTTRRPEAFRD